MSVNSFLSLYHIYLGISVMNPVFRLGSFLIFSQKLINGIGGKRVAIRMSCCIFFKKKNGCREGTSVSDSGVISLTVSDLLNFGILGSHPSEGIALDLIDFISQ